MAVMLEYTKEEFDRVCLEQLNALIRYAGSKSHLAKMLGVSTSTIGGWGERGRISKKGAEKVSVHSKLGQVFTAGQLRPDTE